MLFPQFEMSETQKEEVQKILSQPFYYINKGYHFYAFVSEDGKYILKFLKQRHIRIKPPFFNETLEKRKKRKTLIFQACELSMKDIPDLTGIIAFHLNKTPFMQLTLTLVDKVGLTHSIYIDDYEFVLQEKGIILKDALSEIKTPEILSEKLDMIEEACLTRLKKGIIDSDTNLENNIAFSADGKRVLLIDFNSFYKDKEVTDEKIKKDLLSKFQGLSKWSDSYMPELTPFITEKLKKYER